jgi:hypothetical protein
LTLEKKKKKELFGFGFEPNFFSKKMSREAWGANKITKTDPLTWVTGYFRILFKYFIQKLKNIKSNPKIC